MLVRALVFAFLAFVASPAVAAGEASVTQVQEFAARALVTTFSRGHVADAEWTGDVIGLSSTQGANQIFGVWKDNGVPDEPKRGAIWLASIASRADVTNVSDRKWRVRTIVMQAFRQGTVEGAKGMEVDLTVVQESDGRLYVDAIKAR